MEEGRGGGERGEVRGERWRGGVEERGERGEGRGGVEVRGKMWRSAGEEEVRSER